GGAGPLPLMHCKKSCGCLNLAEDKESTLSPSTTSTHKLESRLVRTGCGHALLIKPAFRSPSLRLSTSTRLETQSGMRSGHSEVSRAVPSLKTALHAVSNT